MRYLIAFVTTLLSFLALDAVWLSTMNAKLYKPLIGPLLADKIDPLAAVLFYLIYIGGVTALVTIPAAREGGVQKAAITGAIFGFVAYATYDLTNAATLKIWSWKITAADMGWGTLATCLAASAGCYALTRLKL